MTVGMPEGKRLAVCLSPDFDPQSLWMATFQSRSQLLMSRGVRRRGGEAPTLADGHEIAAHGVYHEYIPKLGLEDERELFGMQVESHQRLIGRRPRGYRSPALDVTDNTLSLLAEFGFDWGWSLMGPCGPAARRPRLLATSAVRRLALRGRPIRQVTQMRGCFWVLVAMGL